jgi:RNA polymerase sigma-70 factor, ECF subfamily
MPPSQDITQLLLDWSSGDREALDQLFPLVERELHRLARSYMRREQPDHILQTTALVNEAYLRLIDQTKVEWKNRVHFFAVAAKIMRNILIDHARARLSPKHGGGFTHINLDEASKFPDEESEGLLALDEALKRLAALDARKARVVELRYFVGLSIEETAEFLGVSTPTVSRDWDFAKAWLQRELHS